MTDEDHKMRIQLAVDTLLARANDARAAGLTVIIGNMNGPFNDPPVYHMDFTVKRIKTI